MVRVELVLSETNPSHSRVIQTLASLPPSERGDWIVGACLAQTPDIDGIVDAVLGPVMSRLDELEAAVRRLRAAPVQSEPPMNETDRDSDAERSLVAGLASSFEI